VLGQHALRLITHRVGRIEFVGFFALFAVFLRVAGAASSIIRRFSASESRVEPAILIDCRPGHLPGKGRCHSQGQRHR